MLRRADDMCRRRLAREHAGGKRLANRAADARFAVSNRLVGDARLAHADAEVAAAEAFVEPHGARARAARTCTAPACAGTSPTFGDRPGPRRRSRLAHRPRDARRRPRRRPRPRARTSRRPPRAPRAQARRPPRRGAAARPGRAAVRARPHRGVGARPTCAIVAADLIEQESLDARPTSPPSAPRPRAWIAERVELVNASYAADGRARAGCRLQRLPVHRRLRARTHDATIAMTRLRSDITPLTPTSFDDFVRCERRFLLPPICSACPASDAGAVRTIRACSSTTCCGACTRPARATTTRTCATCSRARRRQRRGARAGRAPRASGARRPARRRAAHEHELARFHRQPRRCSWQRLGSTRSGSTTACSTPATTRPAALARRGCATCRPRRCRRSCSRRPRSSRGLRLRLRYEYLQPEIDEDPEPWEPDADDLAAVEEELRSAVERMWELDDWVGVAEADVCGRCQYRSICRDSAAPGEPSWPVLSTPEL